MKMLLVKGYHIPSLNKRNLIMQYVERSIKIKGNELPVGHNATRFEEGVESDEGSSRVS